MEAVKNNNIIQIVQKENQKLPKINQNQISQAKLTSEEQMYLYGEPHLETNKEDKEIMCPPIEDHQNIERKPIKSVMSRANFLNKKIENQKYDNKLIKNIQKNLESEVNGLKTQIGEQKILIKETPRDLNKFIIRSSSTSNKLIKYSNEDYELKKKYKVIKELKEEQDILKSKLDKIEENEALLNSEGFMKLNNSTENLTKFDKSIKEQKMKLNKDKKNDIIERIKEIDFRINQILELENNNYKLTKQQRLENFIENYERNREKIDEKAKIFLKETKKKQNNQSKENKKLEEEFKKKFEEQESKKEKLRKEFIEEEKAKHRERLKKLEEIEKKILNPEHPFDLNKYVKNKNDYKYIKYDKIYRLKEKQLIDKINFKKKMKNKTATPEELEQFIADIDKKKEELKIKKEERDKKEKELFKMCESYKPSYVSQFTEMVDNDYIINLEKERIKKEDIMIRKINQLDFAKRAYKIYNVDENLMKERTDRIVALKNPKLVQIKDTLNKKNKKKKILLKKRDHTKPSKYKFFDKFEETLKKLNNSAILEKHINKRPKSIKFASSYSLEKEESKKGENNDNKKKIDKEISFKKIDYLKQLREKRLLTEKKNQKILNEKENQKDKILKNEKSNYIENIYDIKYKGEILENKAKMEEKLIKYNGGIANNPEAGKKMSGYLIDSIQAKLSILNEMYKEA